MYRLRLPGVVGSAQFSVGLWRARYASLSAHVRPSTYVLPPFNPNDTDSVRPPILNLAVRRLSLRLDVVTESSSTIIYTAMNIYLYYSKNCPRRGYVGHCKCHVEVRKYNHDHNPCRGARVIRDLGDTCIKLLKVVPDKETGYWEGIFFYLYGNCNVNKPGRTAREYYKTRYQCERCDKILARSSRVSHNRRCIPVIQ